MMLQMLLPLATIRLAIFRKLVYSMATKLYTNEAWLKKRYWLDKKTPEEIAKECGTSLETIYVYLAKFKLRRSKR